MKAKHIMLAVILLLASCEKEDEGTVSGTNKHTTASGSSSASKVSKPSLVQNLTYTTTDGLCFRATFDNGGDTGSNMKCTVHWGKYTSKQSAIPSRSSLSKVESMRVYRTTNAHTTFDKEHAGFSGGTYIYYYMECSNSKYSYSTNVTYTIIKR